jgi:hypothetical protein
MSIGIDRHSRVREVLAESGRPDLVEVLIWPALAALTSCPEPHPDALASGDATAVLHVRVRRSAGAFIRVAADVVTMQSAFATSAGDAGPLREPWRKSVVNLSDAYHGVSTLLADIGDDDQHAALVALFRQMIDVADRVASWLESVEPGERPPTPTTSLPEPTSALPTPRPAGASHRRRPWFGTDVDDAQPWPGVANRTLP